MSNAVLIIAGVLVLLLLLFLLIARTPNIRQRIATMKGPVVIVLALILLSALAVIALKLFLPRGENSIFSQAEEESVEETAAPETSETAESRVDGFSLEKALEGNTAGDAAVYITVSGNSDYIGDTLFADPADLKDALLQLKEQTDCFVLVDDYAFAGHYRDTRELLKELGIRYEEMEK